MDKKTFNKKRFFFLSVTFFFFVSMLFFYINVSNVMYDNSGIFFAVKEARNIKNIIEKSNVSFKQANLEYTKYTLDLLLENMEFYPKFLYPQNL